MLRGAHNGQRRREEAREETAAFGDSWGRKSRNLPRKEEGDSAGSPGLISPKHLIKPRERGERKEDRMREEECEERTWKWAEKLRARNQLALSDIVACRRCA